MTIVTRLIASAGLALAAIVAFSPMAAATSWEVEIENFAFLPGGLHISAGDTVTWRNRDSINHTTTSDNGVWDSGSLVRDQRFSFVFNNVGVFPYHCTPHPFMRDTVFVNPLSGANDDTPSAPKDFSLGQNYPNPFNAQTAIRYTLPGKAHVSVQIYDILGRHIANLFDGEKEAGEHEITWDASGAGSGVFFYRVAVEGKTRTGRMTLLK